MGQPKDKRDKNLPVNNTCDAYSWQVTALVVKEGVHSYTSFDKLRLTLPVKAVIDVDSFGFESSFWGFGDPSGIWASGLSLTFMAFPPKLSTTAGISINNILANIYIF